MVKLVKKKNQEHDFLAPYTKAGWAFAVLAPQK
jgi:hypothetical protein